MDLARLKAKARGHYCRDNWGGSSSNEGGSSTSTSGAGEGSTGGNNTGYSGGGGGGGSTPPATIAPIETVQTVAAVPDATISGANPADTGASYTGMGSLTFGMDAKPGDSYNPGTGKFESASTGGDIVGSLLTIGRTILGVLGLANPASAPASALTLGSMYQSGAWGKINFGSAPPGSKSGTSTGYDSGQRTSGNSGGGFTGSPVIGWAGSIQQTAAAPSPQPLSLTNRLSLAPGRTAPPLYASSAPSSGDTSISPATGLLMAGALFALLS